jgi:hypothetical protein
MKLWENGLLTNMSPHTHGGGERIGEGVGEKGEKEGDSIEIKMVVSPLRYPLLTPPYSLLSN